MPLSSLNKKKKTKKKQNKRKTRLKYGIGFSPFTDMKNIHKHEEHTPRKLPLSLSLSMSLSSLTLRFRSSIVLGCGGLGDDCGGARVGYVGWVWVLRRSTVLDWVWVLRKSMTLGWI